MMIRRKNQRQNQRRGMTVVESALVLGVFCLLLFGIFEYCRFLYVLHVTHNAARDGARYATVNMDKPVSFESTDYTDSSGTVFPNIQKYTTARMGGTEKQLTGFQVAVYAVDPVGLTLTPPVIRPKSATAGGPYPDPFNAGDPNKVAWNLATFTEGIAVTAKGTYKPILPSFLFIPSSVPVSVTAIANSEG
jgi:Flp pilus assembly protein TadG